MSVVTELVIDSAGATRGASEYSRAMDSAASAAQRGLGAISDFATQAKGSIANLGSAAASMGPSLATMAVGVTAATAAFVAGFEAVKKMTAGLAEMGLSAKRANLDVEVFQKLQFATGVGGVSNKDFSSGAEKLATNLGEALRSENDMSKLLDANNVKWKDGNKLVLDTNGLLNVARDLIHRAGDEQQKIKMAEMLGLTKDWVPALDKSAQAFAGLQQEASSLGLVISRETIEKAKQFDDEWRKSSEVFSTWMKSKLADLLPLLDELIGKATEFGKGIMDSLDAAAKSPAGQEFNLRSNRASAILEMLSAENDAKENADIVAAAAKAMAGTLSDTTAKLIDQQIATKGLAKFWSDYAASMNAAGDAAEKLGKTQPSAANDNKVKPSVLPDKEEADKAKDALDRSIESVKRHTALTIADTQAQGLGTAALAEFRAQAELVEAAGRADIDVTQKWQDKFDDLAADAGDAALALEKVKVATQIGRDRQTALLSSEDVQIANQLKGIYPDIATALNSSEAAAMRFNNTLKDAKDVTNQFAHDLAHGLMDGKSLADSLTGAFKNLSAKMADKAIDSLLNGDFAKAAVQGIAAVASGIASLFTGNSAAKHAEVIKSIDYVSQLQTRQIAATTDMATLAGQLTAFDHQANIERMNNDRDGGRERAQLEQTLSDERLKIISDFNAQALTATQAAAAAQEAVMKAAQQRIQSAQDRLFNATNDPNTLEGQLAAFDRQALADQLAERDAGGQALIALEAAQAQERLNIIKGYNQKITDAATQAAQQQLDAIKKAAQTIRDYLNNLNVGADTALSPQQRLAAAQSSYNAKLALAQGGNVDALGSITTDAENLRKAAQDFYASGSGFQTILAQIQSQLLALPALSTTDPVVAAVQDVKAAIDQTNTLQTTANGIQLVANSILATQENLLSAINTLSDRDVNAINGLGSITANIGTVHSSQFSIMISLLGTIANNSANSGGGSFWSWLGFQGGGVIPGYADGGIVANGRYGIDSVTAVLPNGRPIGLAGGEYVMPAAQTSLYRSQLDAMRSGGFSAANDNRDYTSQFNGLMRVSAAGSSAIVEVLERRLASLENQLITLNATIRRQNNERPRPGAPQPQKAA